MPGGSAGTQRAPLPTGASLDAEEVGVERLPALVDLDVDGAFVHDSPLSWIARNDTKPERHHANECWVLHASPDWSDRGIDEEPDTVLSQLIESFWRATGCKRRATRYAA